MWLSKLFGTDNEKVIEIKNGRCGELRYLGTGKYAEAYYEISGSNKYDLLVWLPEMKKWSDGTQITDEEKLVIETTFKAWAKRHRLVCQWEEP
jgi:hypothetical protein